MKIATLRHRAVLLANASRSWMRWLIRDANDAPPVPAYAPQLFKLAHIAAGDDDSAAVLTADVIALAPAGESAALRLLIARLPDGWLSWPGAAGPGEWLRLRLRREQADRLLSVMGEWDPKARIALGLHLLYQVRRDDLDAVLGTEGMAEHVSDLITHLGGSLDLLGPASTRPVCGEYTHDLLDAAEPQLGRSVRLHLLGCDRCRKRVEGLRHSTELLRVALTTFFRAAIPPNMAELAALRRRAMRQQQLQSLRPFLVVGLLLALYIGSLDRPAASAALPPPAPSAADLLDRALDRFDTAELDSGVLHERVQLAVGDERWHLERWYDYGASHRMRMTLRAAPNAAPILDVASDGVNSLSYSAASPIGPPQSGRIRGKAVRDLVPLLRQLPAVGSFGDALVGQRYVDINLLATAREHAPTLLGRQIWQGRPVYVLSSRTSATERMWLTLDQETLSLVEASIATTVGGGSSARTVWQADLIEVLPRSEVEIVTFQLPGRPPELQIANPRQIVYRPTSSVDLDTALQSGPLPIPEALPESSILSYVRGRTRFRSSVVQMYEGQWSTLAVEVPRDVRYSYQRQLDQPFEGGRYAIIKHGLDRTSIVDFELYALPDRRMRLYLWHALADDAQRDAMLLAALESLVVVDQHNVPLYRERFFAPTAPEASTTARSGTVKYVTPAAQRRFARLKSEQALVRSDPSLAAGDEFSISATTER